MLKTITLLFITLVQLHAFVNEEERIKREIGAMLMVGFKQSFITAQTPIVQDIKRYNLGGVILFDRFYENKERVKNIQSPAQLKKLTDDLKKYAPSLLIGIDQEGGKVQRLKQEAGFLHTQSAQAMASQPKLEVKKAYERLSLELAQNGINVNFAPVVDLAKNPENSVIYKLERAYGKAPKEVVKYALLLMQALHEKGVIGVLKHFPGHGSSLGDSHKGFVDITQTWDKTELEPYKQLIQNHEVPMIMTAHVFNANLDAKHPATLSYNINTKLLRETLGFKGVIVSDDMQMRGITAQYSLKKSLTLAINSGVDILLFGNQLAFNEVDELVNIIYEQVLKKKIAYQRIVESNERIKNLKENWLK